MSRDIQADGDLFFGETVHQNSKLHSDNELSHTQDQVDMANGGFQHAMVTVGLGAKAGEIITGLASHYLKNPPTAAEKAEWGKTTTENLVRSKGLDGARQVRDDVMKLVSRDARFKGVLTKAQIAERPEVFNALAELAHSERMAGRLN